MKIFILLLSIFLSGCSMLTGTETILDTKFLVKDFNPFASSYLYRPTALKLFTTEDGRQWLEIHSEMYKGAGAANFSLKDAQVVMGFINKYQSWSDLATKRKEILTKNIGEMTESRTGTNLKFDFVSANSHDHYMKITRCGLLCLYDTSLFIDKKNAAILSSVLEKLQNGQIAQLNVDEVYK